MNDTERYIPHDPKRAMIIAAHPDDIEVGSGGTVAKWTEIGVEIIYVVVTDGASGSNEIGVNPHELAYRREQEQATAAAFLGVNQIVHLRYRDTMLEPTMELRRELTRLIRKYQPDRVITHDPATIFFADYYVNHPDHRAAGEAAIYAVFPSAESRLAFPELLNEGLEPHRVIDLWLTLTLNPSHYEDISEYWDKKEQALRKHESQIGQETLDWVRQRNEESGKSGGFQLAEEYRIIRINA